MSGKKWKKIASGKLWFKKSGATDFVEIGDVRDVKVSFDEETAKCFNNSTAIETLVLERTVKQDVGITYSTPEVSIENMSYFLGGEIKDTVYAIGDTLPDMSIASAETTIQSVENAPDGTVIGAFKFVDGDLMEDESGNKFRKTFDIPSAQIRNDGGIDLMTKDFAKLGYKGSALKSDGNPLIKIHYQPVA